MTGWPDAGIDVGLGRVAAPLVPCPVLVGRANEVEVLARSLEDASAGRGGVVFLVGEAGIGKSRLVHELSSMAREIGMRVLRGRAVPGSSGAAFRPLTEALAPVISEATDGDLERWLPALTAVVPSVATGIATELTAPVVGEAVLRLLGSVCAPSGGVLVLEDLHWADPETVGIVEHLSDNLERAPVLCVVTVRSEAKSAARDLVRRVAARRSAQVLQLDHLNGAQVAAMVHRCTGGASPAAVERVVSLAGGVPFLVEEMLVAPGLPASFAEGVAARLDELAEGDRRVLVVAAAFGHHFDWRFLSRATGIAETDVIDALDRGLASQLLAVDGDGFRFRHALTAEAVYASVIPPRREAAAAAALAVLDTAHGEPPVELRDVTARLAERAGHRHRAGRLHLEAGQEALERGALQTAVMALERATRLLTGDHDAQDRAREPLVDALVLVGRADDALSIGRDLVERLPPARAARVHLRLAGAAVTASRWELAAEQLGAARRLIAVAESPVLRAELAVREAEFDIDTNEIARADEQARTALDLARTAGVPEVECAALQLLGRCARRSSLATAETWFRQALDVAERHDLAVWRLRALHEVGTIALLERSEIDALIEAQALAESLGAMGTAAILDIEIAAGCAGRDDLDAEIRHGMQAVHRGTELGMGVIVAYGWQHVAGAAVMSGDDKRAASAATAARAAAPGNQDIEGLLLGGDVIGALVANDLGRALAAAERSAALLRGSQTAPPAYTRAAWPLLLALARRPEAADALAETEQAGVGVARAGSACLTLTSAILTGRTDPVRAANLAANADERLAEVPVWRSLARRLAAEAAIADGWRIPGEWLVEAEACLRSHGYPAAAAACRALRGDAPSGVPAAWAAVGITRREADVLHLVVEGGSNRDIADRLYLSVRTVEKHVESLLRKTATKTRTQLALFASTT